MAITDLGSLELGVCIPGAATAIGIAAPNVQAQLTALASFTPQLSLSFSAQLDICANIIANINAAIAAGVPTISLSAQVTLAAAVIAQLNATLAICLNIVNLLATAGVHLLTYEGAQNTFGSELASYLGSSPNTCHAVIMMTQDPAVWASMGGILKLSA